VKIRWLDQAVLDLKAVKAHIARDNPAAAAGIAQRIREAVQVVGRYPAAGRIGRVPDTREVVVSGTPYIIPYRIKANVVEILRVLHAAQEWPDD